MTNGRQRLFLVFATFGLVRGTVAQDTHNQKQFLIGLSGAEPDWNLLASPHAAELPALRWKLANLETIRKRRAAEFKRQAKELEDNLGNFQ